MKEIRVGQEEMSGGVVAHRGTSWHIAIITTYYNQQRSARLGQAQPSTSPLSHPLIKESKLLEPVLPHCKNAT